VRRLRPATFLLALLVAVSCASVSPTNAPTSPPAQSAAPAGASGAPSSPGVQGSEEPEASGPSPTPPPATAQDLIQQDVDAGGIDEPTGLLYRVYAMFGAAELPEKYATGVATEDEAAIAELQLEQNAGTLPAEIAAQVAPFLARPTDPTSAFYGSAPPVGARQPFAAAAPMDVTCGSDGWASVVSQSIPVTVWGSCAEGRDTSDLLGFMSAIESFYPDEVSVMGDPIPDEGGPDDGGDSNIDVYAVDSCVTRGGQCRVAEFDNAAAVTYSAAPYSGGPASTASGYILIYRGYTDRTDQRSILEHEMFHVLEYAHNYAGIHSGGGKAFWMTEASANWSEEAFVADGRPKWIYPFEGDYQNTKLGLTDTSGSNAYASFMWPYFMEQQQGQQAVANAWDAFRGLTSYDDMNTALSGIVSFQGQFKEFALHAWNSKDYIGSGYPDLISPLFQALDPSMPTDSPGANSKRAFQKVTGAAGPQGNQYAIPEAIPVLAERYQEVDVDDSVQQLVVDFGGLEPSSPLDVIALLHYRDGHWERKDLPPSKTTLCRSDYDITQILFVLADHSFSSDGAVSGQWTMQALTDPCMPTSYKLDLTNIAPSDRPDAGHYEGPAPIECDWLSNYWHVSFMQLQPNNGLVRELTLSTGQYAYIRASTVNSTEDPGDWQIQQGFQEGNLAINIDDQGGDKVKFTVQATDLFQKIDAIITCSVVQRFE